MICALPSDAPRFKEKHQKTIQKSSKNPLKLVLGGLRNTPPKNNHLKSQQKRKTCRKFTILGTPENGERTGVERTFRHFFGFGTPLGHPWAAECPKTSPKISQDPSKLRFLIIFDWFLDDFWSTLGELFAYLFVDFRMCLGRCLALKVGGIGRKASSIRGAARFWT